MPPMIPAKRRSRPSRPPTPTGQLVPWYQSCLGTPTLSWDMASSRLSSQSFGKFFRSQLHDSHQCHKRTVGFFAGQLTPPRGKGRSIQEWCRAPEPGRCVRHVGLVSGKSASPCVSSSRVFPLLLNQPLHPAFSRCGFGRGQARVACPSAQRRRERAMAVHQCVRSIEGLAGVFDIVRRSLDLVFPGYRGSVLKRMGRVDQPGMAEFHQRSRWGR